MHANGIRSGPIQVVMNNVNAQVDLIVAQEYTLPGCRPLLPPGDTRSCGLRRSQVRVPSADPTDKVVLKLSSLTSSPRSAPIMVSASGRCTDSSHRSRPRARRPSHNSSGEVACMLRRDRACSPIQLEVLLAFVFGNRGQDACSQANMPRKQDAEEAVLPAVGTQTKRTGAVWHSRSTQ